MWILSCNKCLCQHQAHSAGIFFFRCTLCNNKESFQAEMLRMGIFIPERYRLHSSTHARTQSSAAAREHLRVFFFPEMHRGSWRRTPILTFWRFTDAVTLTNASAATGALTLLRLGTDRKQRGCWGVGAEEAAI